MAHIKSLGWSGAFLAVLIFLAGFAVGVLAKGSAQGQTVRVTVPDPSDTRRIEALEAQMPKLTVLAEKMDTMNKTLSDISSSLGRIELVLTDPKRR